MQCSMHSSFSCSALLHCSRLQPDTSCDICKLWPLVKPDYPKHICGCLQDPVTWTVMQHASRRWNQSSLRMRSRCMR